MIWFQLLPVTQKNIIWIFGAKNKRCMMHFDAKWLSGSFAINRIFFSWKTNCALSLQKLTIFAPKLVNLHFSSLAPKFKIPMRQIFMKIKFWQQQKWDFFLWFSNILVSHFKWSKCCNLWVTFCRRTENLNLIHNCYLKVYPFLPLPSLSWW